MTDTNFPLSADADMDDLPRTLRREREARQREAMERSSAAPPDYVSREERYGEEPGEPYPAAVTRIDVPFLRLVAFFLKAILAAIPALILLTVILWFFGQGLQTYFPELVKMRIIISFPNG